MLNTVELLSCSRERPLWQLSILFMVLLIQCPSNAIKKSTRINQKPLPFVLYAFLFPSSVISLAEPLSTGFFLVLRLAPLLYHISPSTSPPGLDSVSLWIFLPPFLSPFASLIHVSDLSFPVSIPVSIPLPWQSPRLFPLCSDPKIDIPGLFSVNRFHPMLAAIAG